MSDKIKEEIMKQLRANMVRAIRYTTWVANVVLVPKKDGKTKILMDEHDAEKTTFTTPWAILKTHLMKEVCEQFKFVHRHSTPYRPKANGVVKDTNKNIKKIIQGSRKWHEKLLFSLLQYRTTARTCIGAIPYLLVYGTEAVILAEVKIRSLVIIVESEIEDTAWVKTRLEKLVLIDEKWLAAVCFGQLYQ
nr:uncharacterized protein LOC104090833 [Nicotiana tomentosiformis]